MHWRITLSCRFYITLDVDEQTNNRFSMWMNSETLQVFKQFTYQNRYLNSTLHRRITLIIPAL